MKYIYLIRSEENGYYKIGVSMSPNRRLLALQTGNSSELKLIEIFKSEYSNQIEKTLQRKYSYANKNGEWFDLPIEIEVNFINDCKKIEQNILILKLNNNFFI